MKPITKTLARAFYRAKGYYPTRIGGQEFRCHPQHMSFWKRLREGRWEPETLAVLDRLTPTSTYWDLGAWIGPTVLYAARRAKQVFCLEPDPVAYEYLLANLRLNGLTNVTPLNLALHDRSGLFPMGNALELGNSATSLLCTDTATATVRTPCLTLDALLSLFALPTPDLIKMDVEGAEFQLLPQMQEFLARHKPTLYLSLHAPNLAPAERRPQLERLVAVLRLYRCCFNARQEPVPHEALLEARVQEEFPAFLFTDR